MEPSSAKKRILILGGGFAGAYTIYQVIVFRWFYPSQTLIVAVALAILPYLIFRSLLNRIGQRAYTDVALQDRGVEKSRTRSR